MRSENLGLETGEFDLGLTMGLTCNLKTAQWMAPSQFHNIQASRRADRDPQGLGHPPL